MTQRLILVLALALSSALDRDAGRQRRLGGQLDQPAGEKVAVRPGRQQRHQQVAGFTREDRGLTPILRSLPKKVRSIRTFFT